MIFYYLIISLILAILLSLTTYAIIKKILKCLKQNINSPQSPTISPASSQSISSNYEVFTISPIDTFYFSILITPNKLK